MIDFKRAAQLQHLVDPLRIPYGFSSRALRIGLVALAGIGVGLAVIGSTYYAENAKLIVGLVGGLAFILLTMRWPEFGILSFVALLSGLISLSWLPLLRLGPISLHISDMMLLFLLGLVFLRATSQPGYKLIGSPLLIPLLLFIGAFLLSAANGLMLHNVGFNIILRTVRVLILWVVFIPTLQLVRDEQALRRLLAGLVIFTVVLLIGVLFPNKFEPLLYIEERQAGTGSQMYSDFTRVYFAGDMILYATIPVMVASLAIIKKGRQFWRIGLLALLVYWAFKTFFRQYWITLLIVCILLLAFLSSQERLRLFKRLAPAILLGMLMLVVLVSVYPSLIDRVAYVLSDRIGSLLEDPFRREGSLQWRVIETHYALRQFSRHPLFGIGLANRYRPPMESEASAMYGGWAAKYVENGYLYIAVMMGLAGLIPFLWLSGAYITRFLHYQGEVQDENLRSFYLGFGMAFLGMAACNLASPTFVIGTRLVFFPLIMAISEVIIRLERQKSARTNDLDSHLIDPSGGLSKIPGGL